MIDIIAKVEVSLSPSSFLLLVQFLKKPLLFLGLFDGNLSLQEMVFSLEIKSIEF